LQLKTKIVTSHTADSKPVKQEVNSTAMLPPLAFPGQTLQLILLAKKKVLIRLTNWNLAPSRFVFFSWLAIQMVFTNDSNRGLFFKTFFQSQLILCRNKLECLQG
jgi:hypothetical protein